MNKYIRSDEIKDNIPNSNPVIKISHFDNDKCIKTDIYPISLISWIDLLEKLKVSYILKNLIRNKENRNFHFLDIHLIIS